MKYCQGPLCHTYKTKDRIRGPKGYKQYQTRKRSEMNYNGNFCSLGCQDDWFKKFGDMAIDHFGRIHEPKSVMADGAWYKDYTYGYPNNTNHCFKNDLLGQRIAITQAQYDDDNFTSPN
jgi:hypothetical protein